MHRTAGQAPKKEAVKVRVLPAKVDLRSGTVNRSPSSLPLDFFNVDLGGFGIPNAIIFRPKEFTVSAGSYFWVEVSGLVDKDDEPATLEYLVGFFGSA